MDSLISPILGRQYNSVTAGEADRNGLRVTLAVLRRPGLKHSEIAEKIPESRKDVSLQRQKLEEKSDAGILDEDHLPTLPGRIFVEEYEKWADNYPIDVEDKMDEISKDLEALSLKGGSDRGLRSFNLHYRRPEMTIEEVASFLGAAPNAIQGYFESWSERDLTNKNNPTQSRGCSYEMGEKGNYWAGNLEEHARRLEKEFLK